MLNPDDILIITKPEAEIIRKALLKVDTRTLPKEEALLTYQMLKEINYFLYSDDE